MFIFFTVCVEHKSSKDVRRKQLFTLPYISSTITRIPVQVVNMNLYHSTCGSLKHVSLYAQFTRNFIIVCVADMKLYHSTCRLMKYMSLYSKITGIYIAAFVV